MTLSTPLDEERDPLTPEGAFANWFAVNYPSGTFISDPFWHAPKILRAARYALEAASRSSGEPALEREARSLDDYANEVESEMTAAVLRGAAKRLRALSGGIPRSLSEEPVDDLPLPDALGADPDADNDPSLSDEAFAALRAEMDAAPSETASEEFKYALQHIRDGMLDEGTTLSADQCHEVDHAFSLLAARFNPPSSSGSPASPLEAPAPVDGEAQGDADENWSGFLVLAQRAVRSVVTSDVRRDLRDLLTPGLIVKLCKDAMDGQRLRRASLRSEPASPLSDEDAKFVVGVQAGIDAGAYTARGVIIGLLAVIHRLVPSPGDKGNDNG